MTHEDNDHRLTKLIDMASGVMEGAGRYEQRTDKLIQDLNALRQDIAARASTYEAKTKTTLNNAADSMATTVAAALMEKMKDANQAAERARSAYEKATRRLGWKLFALALLLQTILFVGGWMLIQRTIPTLDDIASRRQQLADLATQIQTEQKTLDFLNGKGARMQWIRCDGHPCVRVDTRRTYEGTDDVTKEYFIPWGY